MTEQEEPFSSPIELMDAALYFINSLVDLNIEMQELIIEIRRKLIKNERGVLEFLHAAIERAERLRHQFKQHASEFKAMEQLIPPDLFARFYGRVSEKMFSKFLYYSLNNRALQFTTGSLLELFKLYQEIHHPRYLSTFDFYSAVVDFVIAENRSFAEVLLELIVSEDYVCSLDEFFILKGIQRPDGGFSFHPDDEKTWQRFLPQEPGQTSRKPKHRNGHIFQSDFRNKLQDMVNKYQDGRLREEFLNTLSQSILREFQRISNNDDQTDIFRKFARKSMKQPKAEHKRSPERKHTLKNKHRKSQHLPDQLRDADLYENKSTKEGEFFVGTHSANLLSKMNTPMADLAGASVKPLNSSHHTQTPTKTSKSLKKGASRRESHSRRLLSKTMAEVRNASNSNSNASIIKPRTGKPANLRSMKYREQFRPLFERLVPKSASNQMDYELVFLPRNMDSCLNLFQSQLDQAVGNIFRELDRPLKKVSAKDIRGAPNRKKPKANNTNLQPYRHAHLVMSKIQQSMLQKFGDGWEDTLITQAAQEDQDNKPLTTEKSRPCKSRTFKTSCSPMLGLDIRGEETVSFKDGLKNAPSVKLSLGRRYIRKTNPAGSEETEATSGSRLGSRATESRPHMELYNTALRCLLKRS